MHVNSVYRMFCTIIEDINNDWSYKYRNILLSWFCRLQAGTNQLNAQY